MTEPTTTNIGLTVPNTGDLPGAWGTAAINPNMQIVDGLAGGVLNLSFSSATTIVLTNNGASITPSPGPFQAYNALISLSGALSGNCFIECPNPGIYRVLNNCTNTNTFGVAIGPTGGLGQFCGCPPGEITSFFYDGTNVYFMGLERVGVYVSFGTNVVPNWFSLCTVQPYLPCWGGTYNVASYPALAAYLGSAFGGDGVTTFGVPDFQSRVPLMRDVTGVSRITGVMSGTVFGATGGDQFLAAHNHSASASVSDPGHAHPGEVGGGGGGGGNSAIQSQFDVGTLPPGTLVRQAVTNISVGVTVAIAGNGGGQNLQPTIVSGLTFIKT